jgi:NADPH:quinone reductase
VGISPCWCGRRWARSCPTCQRCVLSPCISPLRVTLCMSYQALGAKVIATAGSDSKLEVCKKYGGADVALNYRTKGWQNEVMKITGGKGAGTSHAGNWVHNPSPVRRYRCHLRSGGIDPRLTEVHRVERPRARGWFCGRQYRKGGLLPFCQLKCALTSCYNQLPMNLVLLKNISIVGLHWGAYLS